MILKVNLEVGEMGFMVYDLEVSLKQKKPLPGNEFNHLPCLTSVLPGDTSDSQNSSKRFIDIHKCANYANKLFYMYDHGI